jgi:AraC-like DNA-binding protein
MTGTRGAKISEASSPEAPASFRVSSDDFPEADRIGIFREMVGKQVMRQEIEPLPDEPLYLHATVRPMPGLLAYWAKGSPVRLRRTEELLSDGNDNLLFQWTGSARNAEHLRREIPLGPGDAILFSCSDTRSTLLPSPFETVTLSIPRKALQTLLRDADGCLARAIPANSGTLRLLLGYLALLREELPAPAPELRDLAVAHVYDLLAVVLGATRDAAETARRRGVSAARLLAIKRSIRDKFADGDLSVAILAAEHRVTPRYVQMLFENQGTTFTAFLRGERLASAHRMLASPRFGARKVVDVAFACGFADISFFNRVFRAHFGATPSDIRARSSAKGSN